MLDLNLREQMDEAVRLNNLVYNKEIINRKAQRRAAAETVTRKLIEHLKHSMYYHLRHHYCKICLKSDRIAVHSQERLLTITIIFLNRQVNRFLIETRIRHYSDTFI